MPRLRIGFYGDRMWQALLDGVPHHRDSLLSDTEQAAGDAMLICVSRSRTPRLVLELWVHVS